MAYWHYKTVKKYRYVFVYTAQGRPLSRAETKHLDARTPESIDAWVQDWALKNEGKAVRQDQILWEDSNLGKYLSDYIEYLKARGAASKTWKQQQSLLRRYAITYFLSHDPPLRDPSSWPGVAVKLLPWMQEKKVTDPIIHRTNVALRGFWTWLQDEGLVHDQNPLRLRNPPGVSAGKKTPLSRVVTPDDVLAWALLAPPDVRFLGLLGYFASLRPQETFLLARENFVAGSKAAELECCKSHAALDLFARFAVKIDAQLTPDGPDEVKANSGGWVGVWNEIAAQWIVKLVNGTSGRYLRGGLSHQYRRWRKDGIMGITLKDLRRASLYWLAHHTAIKEANLMKHSRHRRLETLTEYMRRPEETATRDDVLDLGA